MPFPRVLRRTNTARNAPRRWAFADAFLSRANALLPQPIDRMMPVSASGRNIARSFWGRAFCRHLESYGDFSNRLPRGRTYLRRGAVLHLEVEAGGATGLVLGSDLYVQRVSIVPMGDRRTRSLAEQCAGDIDAVVDLFSGALPEPVLSTLTAPGHGLFPEPSEIDLDCSCPDGAYLCKHLAAVLYGIAVRLDEQPDLLFVLRGIDPASLVAHVPEVFRARPPPPERRLDTDLGALFDIDIEPVAKTPLFAEDAEEAPDDDAPVLVPRRLLLHAGLTAAQVEAWLRQERVTRTDKRGIYELTPSGWEALEPLLDDSQLLT